MLELQLKRSLKKLKYYLKAIRVNHWTKNLLVFAAPIFSFQIDSAIWIESFKALFCFCLISSSIYLINDCLDVSSDRNHPIKKLRPISAGKISITEAILLAIFLAVLGLSISFQANIFLFYTLISYIAIQIGYCIKLKQYPLIDLFCISSGFLLRAIAGGITSKLTISPWFLLTIGLLALFLALEKRKAELRIFSEGKNNSRKVLKRYSLPLLLRIESLVSTSSFVTYALWAAGPSLNGAKTSWMLITVPFVLVGIFRYQLLTDPSEVNRRQSISKCYTGENPEEILIHDKGIQLTLLGWLLTTFIIGITTIVKI